MTVTVHALARRFLGIRELSGAHHHPLIQWWLSLCDLGPDAPDETPWCSAFVNGLAWQLNLPRSRSAAARSWLAVGTPVPLDRALVGWDIVILQRGDGPQPGPEVTSGAPGHVGVFAGWRGDDVLVLGGNQGDAVTVAPFPTRLVLGVRRLRVGQEET